MYPLPDERHAYRSELVQESFGSVGWTLVAVSLHGVTLTPYLCFLVLAMAYHANPLLLLMLVATLALVVLNLCGIAGGHSLRDKVAPFALVTNAVYLVYHGAVGWSYPGMWVVFGIPPVTAAAVSIGLILWRARQRKR